MTKHAHLITVKQYVESEGITLDSYWLRRLGQMTLDTFKAKHGDTKKPPKITRGNHSGKGYDPVEDKEVLEEALRIILASMDAKTKYDALYSKYQAS